MKLITGNTFPVKDKLKALPGGARWNAEAKGWEVNDRDEAAALALVAAAPRSQWNGAKSSANSPAKSTKAVNWSAEQATIFNFFAAGQGNAIVQARAGTGKTTTIKEAFSHVVGDSCRMLYAVFNKKNQIEAMEKISDPRVEVRTLHALGFSFIKSVWTNAKPENSVEGERIVAAIEKLFPLTEEMNQAQKLAARSGEAVSAVEKLVGFAKNLFITVPTAEQLLAVIEDREIYCGVTDEQGREVWLAAKLAAVGIAAMTAALTRDESGRISFNDMVWLPVAQNWVKPRFDLVVIDEAQDMNLPQLEIALRAARETGRIIVVGDDRQAIYGFRGAAQDGMKAMQNRLNATVLGLTTTYRCPRAVVALAKLIVPDYNAAPSAPQGEIHEIEFPAMFGHVQPGDAILSRANAPLMGACLQLLRQNIPARIEGRDVGARLAGMVKKLKAKSVPDFFRKLENWAAKQIARRPKSADEINDERATLEAIAEGCASVNEIAHRLTTMFSDSDEGCPKVVLSTVHKAKGLEWSRVFLLEWTFNGKGDEAANIRYVAITRTKKTLVHVWE